MSIAQRHMIRTCQPTGGLMNAFQRLGLQQHQRTVGIGTEIVQSVISSLSSSSWFHPTNTASPSASSSHSIGSGSSGEYRWYKSNHYLQTRRKTVYTYQQQRFNMSTSTTKNANTTSQQPSLLFQATCDLYDQYLDKAKVPTLTTGWRHYGGTSQFCGRAVTIKLFEDNSRLKELCETPALTANPKYHNEYGTVLVVDAGASMRCAVLGDMLAKSALHNGYQGIIVYGCVRDAAELQQLETLGICAMGTTPRKSTRRGEGQVNLPIQMADVVVAPGDYVYADLDGVLFLDPNDVNTTAKL